MNFTMLLTEEAYMLFNPQNPTGHYKLSLENSTDFAVAQQLLLLDRWECVVNRRNRRLDVARLQLQSEESGGGNYEQKHPGAWSCV